MLHCYITSFLIFYDLHENIKLQKNLQYIFFSQNIQCRFHIVISKFIFPCSPVDCFNMNISPFIISLFNKLTPPKIICRSLEHAVTANCGLELCFLSPIHNSLSSFLCVCQLPPAFAHPLSLCTAHLRPPSTVCVCATRYIRPHL